MTTLAALAEAGRWTDTRKRTAEETYEDVRKLICHTVWRIVKKCGGDFDEYMSEANEVFLTAYADFDGSCPFSNWLVQMITYRLLDVVRDRCHEQSRCRPAPNDSVGRIPVWSLSADADSGVNPVENVPDARPTWRIGELLEELGDDARTVVQLVVETPAELDAIVKAKGDQPRNYRSSIRNYLAELGWTAVRVAESFAEVRRALAE
jgi:RNA polymerase sigma factor (sigma-70 family)